jgi:hypothetical protein
MRVSKRLAIAGILAVIGVGQYVVMGLPAPLAEKLNLSDVPIWTGLLLIGIAVLILIVARPRPAPKPAPPPPHPHDVELLQSYRQRVTPQLIGFLAEHDFRFPFRRDILDPLETMAHEWRGSKYKFQDSELQAKLAGIIAVARQFCRLTGERLYSDDSNPVIFQTLIDVDRRHVIHPSTLDAIKAMNELSSRLSEAMDDFEQLARTKIRHADGVG